LYEAYGRGDVRAVTSNDADVIVVVHWTFTVNATGKRASMFMQHWWRSPRQDRVLPRLRGLAAIGGSVLVAAISASTPRDAIFQFPISRSLKNERPRIARTWTMHIADPGISRSLKNE